MQPGGTGSFLEGDMQASAKSVNELQDRCGFRFENRFHYQPAVGIENRSRDRCLVNVEPNILGIIHEGAPSCVGLGANDQNLLQWAPFHNAFIRSYGGVSAKQSASQVWL